MLGSGSKNVMTMTLWSASRVAVFSFKTYQGSGKVLFSSNDSDDVTDRQDPRELNRCFRYWNDAFWLRDDSSSDRAIDVRDVTEIRFVISSSASAFLAGRRNKESDLDLVFFK